MKIKGAPKIIHGFCLEISYKISPIEPTTIFIFARMSTLTIGYRQFQVNTLFLSLVQQCNFARNTQTVPP